MANEAVLRRLSQTLMTGQQRWATDLVIGKIVSYSAGIAVVQAEQTGVNFNAYVLSSYNPVANDIVLMLRYGPSYFIIGSIAAFVATPTRPVTFSYPGQLNNNVESPPWYPKVAETFTQVRVSLLANATTNHVVLVNKNGTLFGTYTLNSGNKTTTSAITLSVVTTDYLTVKTSSVTDTNLTVELT